MRLLPLLPDARRLALLPARLHHAFRGARPEAIRFAARAWLGAPLVRASLSLVGLRSTLRWVEASSRQARRRAHARGVGVEEGRALVRGAFRAQGAGGCLPQSLVQYLLHRRDGLPVRLVVGVKRPGPGSGIDAHAWVEAAEAGARPDDPSFVPLFASSPVTMEGTPIPPGQRV
jgi:hypothetical protein